MSHKSKQILRFVIALFFIALLLIVIPALLTPSKAEAVISAPTLYAQHPSISEQPEVGKGIDDMAIHENRLYLGNGDYTANTGPTDVAYVDLATGSPGVDITAPTEEINTFRIFNGNLHIPWVDPTGPGSALNGGMTTSVGGWRNENLFPAGHVYDYTEVGMSRFLVGAVAYSGAGVWQSDDGGPWRLVREAKSSGGATGWERFYFAITLNDTVYVQAKHNGGTEAQPSGDMFKMQSWDGSRWRGERASITGVVQGKQIEVFKNRAYFGTSVFNGSRTVRSDVPMTSVRDWYNAGDHLYALGSNGALARTDGSGAWETVGQVTLADGARPYSLAVDGSTIYIGTNTGLVYRLYM